MTIVICLALLFSDQPAAMPSLNHAMQFTCIACEIMDERERKYMFAKADDFQFDLGTMRKRWRDLYDAPRLHECYLWPERCIVTELLQVNRSQKMHFENVRELYPHDLRFVAIIDDLNERYRLWDYARDARCEYYYIHVRREAMKKLLRSVGEQEFSRGELPSVVPMGDGR